MSEESEARQPVIYDDQKIASIVKVADRNEHGIMELGDFFICDSADYDTYDNIRDEGGCDASQLSTEKAAHRQSGDIYFSPSEHCKNISKISPSLIPELQQEKSLLKLDQQIKQTLKHITKKYLQTVKRFTSNLKDSAAKIGFLKFTQKEINKQTISNFVPVSFRGKLSKCKKNTQNKTNNDSNSPIRNFIRIHRRDRCKISGNNTAIGVLLKLKLSLKSYITGFIMKSDTSNKLKRCNHMCYEQQPVIFNYIFPYRCSSSESIEESDEQSENSYELNDSSTTLTSDSSTESFSDSQETRHQAQIRIGMPMVNIEPCVRNMSMYNNYNAYRSDDLLIRHLNLDTNTNRIKTLRRVTLKRHHKRVTSKSYRHSFNKKYQTYFAEISYMNQVLDLPPACRQGVGIGSTWDVSIDFGRGTTQDLSAHSGDTPNLGQIDNIKTGAGHILSQYQCPPGVCTTSKCNPKKCYKLLKKSAPYGSHASSQVRKYKGRDRRRKRSNGKHVGVGKGTKRVNNDHISLSSRGQPHRQKIRIGSKTGFHVKFYRESPLSARSINRMSNRCSDNKKHNRARRKHKALKTFKCPPGTCDPRNCKSRDCYQRLKAAHIGIITDPCLLSSSHGGSQVGTQSRKIKGRHLRAGRETFYKEEGTLSMPKSKMQLNMPNRQAVRIGSKCSFNIEFYRIMPRNDFVTNEYDQGDTSGRKQTSSKKNRKVIKKYQCEPGVCVPGQCNANTCFQELKSMHSQAALSGSSKGTSQGSQASTKKKRLEMENATLYKDKGSLSMPRPKMSLHMPNRQAVRIGSKCSFNIEFYRSMPQNRYMNMHDQGDSGIRRMPSFQCEPGACIPGKCNTNDCFQILKAKHKTSGVDSSLTGSMTQGSQASSDTRKKRQALKAEKATFYKDKGLSSMPRPKTSLHLPNRQAVRIGSKCSFNIEFYRSMPYNRLGMNEYNQGDSGKIHQPRLQCEPGVCIPGKCNANDCFLTLKAKTKFSGSSLSGSSNVTSQSSQAATKWRKNKNRQLHPEKSTYYRDRGVSSKPISNNPYKPHRQAVRIGSKCSFNIEFYKSMPQNDYMTRDPSGNFLPNSYHQGDTYSQFPHKAGAGNKIISKNKYACEPGICTPGKCNAMECLKLSSNKLECKPKTCVPGKCDPRDCYKRIKSTPTSIVTDTSYTGNSIGSNPVSTQSRKLKGRQLRAGKEKVFKEKGMSSIPRHKQTLHLPNRQAVRIGSNCSFNIEFYKAMPHMSPVMSGQSYEPVVNLPNNLYTGSNQKQISGYQYSERYNQGDIPVQFKAATKRKRRTSNMLQCHPGVCIPGKCDSRECYQRIRATNIIPGTEGSYTDSSYATSRGSQFSTKKSKNKRPELSAGNATFYRDRGASSMTKSKTPMQKLNRQAVRIGSTCSFNIDFYKNLPHAPMHYLKPPHAEQIQSRQYPEQYYPTSTESDGTDRTRKPDKDQGDVTVQEKKKSSKQSNQPPPHKPTVKRKLTKGKTIQTKKPLPKTINNLKQNEQGDAITEVTPKTEKQLKKSKEKTTQKRKTPILQDQGDTTVQRDAGTDIKTKTSKEKTKRIRQSISIGDQGDKGFEYELGVCIPNKCDPYLCFERLRNRDDGTSTDASLTTSSKHLKTTPSSSGVSKSTSVKLDNEEEAERRKQARKHVYKNKGISTTTIDKNNIDMIQPIATFHTPGQNKNIKNVVRIGSSCSFNIQLYKEKPLTEAEANAIRSASISSQDLNKREVKKEERSFMSSIKKCCCKLIGNPRQSTICQSTIARQSQTKCCRNDCPAIMKLIDAGIGTPQPGTKCTVPCYSANAATQSRRYPLLQNVARYEKSLSSAICKCCGNFAPSRATTGFRNMPLYNNYRPSGPAMGYGDNFNGCQPCQIREQAIIIGSGCGFNVNFFKKPKVF